MLDLDHLTVAKRAAARLPASDRDDFFRDVRDRLRRAAGAASLLGGPGPNDVSDRDARRAVVEELRKRGINVAAEQLDGG